MNLKALPKIVNPTIYFLAAACLTSCAAKEKNKNNQWATAAINAAISKDSIYKELDKQQEVFSVLEPEDTVRKRTSGVAYFSGEKINLQDDKYATLNNCRAYFLHSDTLSIIIGIGNGFGGSGFIIQYKDNKFYTEPYFSTDVVMEDEPKSTYKIVYQKLTLDKSAYSLGDSLYGKIDFTSIETDKNKDTIRHLGKGYFRTMVTRL